MSSATDALSPVRDRLREELRDAYERASNFTEPSVDDEAPADFAPTLGYQQRIVAGLSTALDLIDGEPGRRNALPPSPSQARSTAEPPRWSRSHQAGRSSCQQMSSAGTWSSSRAYRSARAAGSSAAQTVAIVSISWS